VTEPRGRIRDLVSTHRRIALDANVLIELLDGDGARAEAAAAIVDAVAGGEVEAVISSLALSETLVGPARAGDGARFELAAATIRDLGIGVVGLDAGIAEDAAWIRGTSTMGLADAVHVATARAAGATALITSARRVRARPHLEVRLLDDLAEDAAES
jgi:predicted nucleic acid-binding protein